jgi:molybdate transport system ATP-binding protein
VIDVDLQLSVQDRHRRFDLAVRFATDAPFAALYGPSGSGKTLTLQAMAGLLRPEAGHVRLNGRSLFDAASGINLPAPQRRVGYLFQHYALFPHLSVRQNVAFGLTAWHQPRLTAPARQRVDALLDQFDLTALAHSRPASLSGGQQQRVALARALACEPQVLLLDEPFAALSPALRQNLRSHLAQVCRQWRIPTVMITHDADDVLALADVAFIYQQGQVVQEVNLHDASSQSFQWQAPPAQASIAASPLQQKLRQMLTVTPR